MLQVNQKADNLQSCTVHQSHEKCPTGLSSPQQGSISQETQRKTQEIRDQLLTPEKSMKSWSPSIVSYSAQKGPIPPGIQKQLLTPEKSQTISPAVKEEEERLKKLAVFIRDLFKKLDPKSSADEIENLKEIIRQIPNCHQYGKALKQHRVLLQNRLFHLIRTFDAKIQTKLSEVCLPQFMQAVFKERATVFDELVEIESFMLSLCENPGLKASNQQRLLGYLMKMRQDVYPNLTVDQLKSMSSSLQKELTRMIDRFDLKMQQKIKSANLPNFIKNHLEEEGKLIKAINLTTIPEQPEHEHSD